MWQQRSSRPENVTAAGAATSGKGSGARRGRTAVAAGRGSKARSGNRGEAGRFCAQGNFSIPSRGGSGISCRTTFSAQSSRGREPVRERSHDGDRKNSRAQRHPREGESGTECASGDISAPAIDPPIESSPRRGGCHGGNRPNFLTGCWRIRSIRPIRRLGRLGKLRRVAGLPRSTPAWSRACRAGRRWLNVAASPDAEGLPLSP